MIFDNIFFLNKKTGEEFSFFIFYDSMIHMIKLNGKRMKKIAEDRQKILFKETKKNYNKVKFCTKMYNRLNTKLQYLLYIFNSQKVKVKSCISRKIRFIIKFFFNFYSMIIYYAFLYHSLVVISVQVTALYAGLLGEDERDVLLVGTATHLLAYNVEDNADVFYKEVINGFEFE